MLFHYSIPAAVLRAVGAAVNVRHAAVPAAAGRPHLPLGTPPAAPPRIQQAALGSLLGTLGTAYNALCCTWMT